MKIQPADDVKALNEEMLIRNNPDHILVAASDLGHKIISSVDETPVGRMLHVSVVHPDRMTTMEELLEVSRAFFDGDAIVALPKRSKFKEIPNRRFDLWTMPWAWDRF